MDGDCGESNSFDSLGFLVQPQPMRTLAVASEWMSEYLYTENVSSDSEASQ